VRVLAAIGLVALMLGISCLLMLGWAYEGPRRLLVRLKEKTMKVFKCAG